MHQQQTAFENIEGKEEIARNEQFLLFPQCFLLSQTIVPHSSILLTSFFYLLLNWKSQKLVYGVKGYVPKVMPFLNVTIFLAVKALPLYFLSIK